MYFSPRFIILFAYLEISYSNLLNIYLNIAKPEEKNIFMSISYQLLKKKNDVIQQQMNQQIKVDNFHQTALINHCNYFA